MKLEFGKHAGKDLADVPREYIEWFVDSRRKDLATYEAELARRDALEASSQTMVEKLVQAGFRQLALRAHPDQGGSVEEFRELQGAKAVLDTVLRELKK